MFIVISDHGGHGTSHGDPENPYINKTIFFSQHPSIFFDHNYSTNQTDLAPTILNFIGISDSGFDRKTDGRSILQKN